MERAETEVSRIQSTEIMTYKDGEGPKNSRNEEREREGKRVDRKRERERERERERQGEGKDKRKIGAKREILRTKEKKKGGTLGRCIRNIYIFIFIFIYIYIYIYI